MIRTILVSGLSALLLISSQVSIAQNKALANAAESLTQDDVTYNPAYFSIAYPGGDVPAEYGVCTDVVIRAYRKLGTDLQQFVHEDMQQDFDLYPKLWGLKKPDSNIDHRRVPNLMCFFERYGHNLPISKQAIDYKAGDIVCWRLPGNLTHIGIVSNNYSGDGVTPLIVHNIGAGQVEENCLFNFDIIGHYSYPK